MLKRPQWLWSILFVMAFCLTLVLKQGLGLNMLHWSAWRSLFGSSEQELPKGPPPDPDMVRASRGGAEAAAARAADFNKDVKYGNTHN